MKTTPLHSPNRSQLRRGSFLIAFGQRLVLPLFFLCAALLAQPCAATPFQWEYTGSLNVARERHTATLLSGGEVLVAGGDMGLSNLTATAELYDPATEHWIFTGSLNTARNYHTATLLFDGRVLVAGGAGASASAELYDPATGNWTYTGSLNTPRYWHTATLLPDGRVLVAGGNGASASAELYDPATGNWTYTGNLTPREWHTATLLPDGRVLAVGGSYDNNHELASAQLYDPATGTWTFTGSLNTGRYFHTATLLPDGKVMVAGGYNYDNRSTLASAELYDPATGNWTFTGSLHAARSSHTATLLPDGRVLAAGGYTGLTIASAELYDPATGTWTVTGSLNTARDSHTATLLPNGEVLAAGGGSSGVQAFASAELYDPGIVSRITPAETTCSQFSSGTAEALGSVQYDVTNDLVQRVLPRNFLYWVKVTAPAGDNILRITQAITTGNFNTFFAGKGNGSNVFDSNCVSLERAGSQSGDTATVKFNAPAAGTYYIAINFIAQSLIGQPAPSPTTVHYDFTTTGVPDSTSGLDLVKH